MNIIAATGHRPKKLGGYSKTIETRLFNLALEYLRKARPTMAISGMALGWDMAFADACEELGIPFIAAIPFIGQESVWPEQSQERYKRLLTKAHRVHVVSDGQYMPFKMALRNEWMVDSASKIAALWDGSAGGTANCVAYAIGKGKPIDNLWERYQL